jgi:cbb3-type cytochrome oxidase subunit 3
MSLAAQATMMALGLIGLAWLIRFLLARIMFVLWVHTKGTMK